MYVGLIFNLAFSSSSSVDEGDVALRLLLFQLRRGWVHLLLLHLPQRGEPCVCARARMSVAKVYVKLTKVPDSRMCLLQHFPF